MLPCLPRQLHICGASKAAIWANRARSHPCIHHETCAGLERVWLRVGVAGVEGVEESLSGDLSGMLIARSHAGARGTRKGRETTRVVIVRHDGWCV